MEAHEHAAVWSAAAQRVLDDAQRNKAELRAEFVLQKLILADAFAEISLAYVEFAEGKK